MGKVAPMAAPNAIPQKFFNASAAEVLSESSHATCELTSVISQRVLVAVSQLLTGTFHYAGQLFGLICCSLFATVEFLTSLALGIVGYIARQTLCLVYLVRRSIFGNAARLPFLLVH
jgi:hypothetical protein